MTDSTERRCGTCRHFADVGRIDVPVGTCSAPAPESYFGGKKQYMHEDEGKSCPTWEARND